MRFTLPLIAFAALAAAPAVSANQDNIIEVPVSVSYAGIDITSADGRTLLEKRVEAKLQKACTIETASRFSYGRKIVDQKCVADARAEAMEAIAQVAANEARGGRQVSAN